jgi:hypothetical protein
MFNLVVKYQPWVNGRDTLMSGRMFEYTEQSLIEKFSSRGQPDLDQLATLPTLFVQETAGLADQVAHVGAITRAKLNGRDILLDYTYDMGIAGIPNKILKQFALDLDIADFEFERTHWAVKDADLFRVLLKNAQPRRQRPTVFQLAEFENIEPSLVSAMMPFHPHFDAVYSTLQRTAEAAGLRCRRADDIWENPAVIQDVVSLIDRSSVVICDCTNRNPNVFYEIGIAHSLGREVILITQAETDIPFDLRHLRYVPYLNNGEGLAALSSKLLPRLTELALGSQSSS